MNCAVTHSQLSVWIWTLLPGFVEWAPNSADLWPYHGLRRGFHFTEREETLASPTRFSETHILTDAFPTMNQTHNSVVLWQKSRDVGDRMSGVLPGTHSRPDPQWTIQSSHSLQVKGKMERARIWEKTLFFLIYYRNFGFFFQIFRGSYFHERVASLVFVQFYVPPQRLYE